MPDSKHLDVMRKLEEHRIRRLSTYNELGLQNASSLALPGYPLQITPAELFDSI